MAAVVLAHNANILIDATLLLRSNYSTNDTDINDGFSTDASADTAIHARIDGVSSNIQRIAILAIVNVVWQQHH